MSAQFGDSNSDDPVEARRTPGVDPQLVVVVAGAKKPLEDVKKTVNMNARIILMISKSCNRAAAR